MDLSGGWWMLGLAGSRQYGTATYRFQGATAGSGTMDLELNALYPYARLAFGGATELWAVGGFGEGDLELTRSVTGGSERADLEMQLGMFGLRQRLLRAGPLEFSIRGDVGAVRLESRGDRSLSAGLEGEAIRGRAGLEGSVASKLGALRFRPFAQVAGRYDSGSSLTGGGLEIAGGFDLESGGGRFRLQALASILATHEVAGYRERGFGGTVELRPVSPAGDGLSVRVSPRFGSLSTGAGTLWGEEPFAGLAQGGSAFGASVPRRAGGDTRIEVGYGYGVGAGVVTPFSELMVRNAGGEERHLRFGLRYGLLEAVTRAMNVEFGGERLSGFPGAAARYRFLFRGQIRF